MSYDTQAQKNGTTHEKAYRKRTVAPPIDVYENPDEILVIVDVPGALADSITLDVDKDTLTLTARPELPENVSGRALSLESAPVDYVRSFRIPPGIDASRITAQTKHGTLVVHLPKVPEAKPRKILIQGG